MHQKNSSRKPSISSSTKERLAIICRLRAVSKQYGVSDPTRPGDCARHHMNTSGFALASCTKRTNEICCRLCRLRYLTMASDVCLCTQTYINKRLLVFGSLKTAGLNVYGYCACNKRSPCRIQLRSVDFIRSHRLRVITVILISCW